MKKALLACLVFTVSLYSLDGLAVLRAIPDNTWIKLESQGDSIAPVIGHTNITVDCDKGRIYYFGSDTHGSNNNNAVWYFDLATFIWHQVYPDDPPSTYVKVTNDAVLGAGKFWAATSTGHPVAGHVFDALKYVPKKNMALLLLRDNHNNTVYNQLGDIGEPTAWIFNTETLTWKLLTSAQYPDIFTYGFAVTPDGSGAVSGAGGATYEFNFADSTWNSVVAARPNQGYHLSMEYDTHDSVYVDFGGGAYTVYNPRTRTWAASPEPDGPLDLINGPNCGYDTLNRMFIVQTVVNGEWAFGNPYPDRDYTWVRSSAAPAGKRWRIVKRWDRPGDTLPPYNGFSFKGEYDLANNVFYFMNGNTLWAYRFKTAATVARERAMTGLTLLTGKDTIEMYLSTRLSYVMHGRSGATDTSSNFLFCEPVSLDSSIAVASWDGVVTGISGGTARFIMEKNGFRDTLTITVKPSTAVLDSIIIAPDSVSRMAAEMCSLSATGYFHKDAETFTRIIDTVAAWASTDTLKARVSKGVVSFVSAGGPVTITAALDGKTGSAFAVVWPHPAFIKRINFSSRNTPWKYGWLADAGAAYDSAQGYGWIRGAGASREDRNGANYLLKSFVTGDSGAQYEIKVPDGSYIIKTGMGDNAYGVNSYNWIINGTDTVNSKPSGLANGVNVDTIQVTGGAGALFYVSGPFNYIVIISNEGIDVNTVADDNGLLDNEALGGTGVEGGNEDPDLLDISVLPNPLNPAAVISLRAGARVAGMEAHVAVYNIRGALVKVFPVRRMGRETAVRWDASGAASGVYLIRVKAGGREVVRKMVLQR